MTREEARDNIRWALKAMRDFGDNARVTIKKPVMEVALAALDDADRLRHDVNVALHMLQHPTYNDKHCIQYALETLQEYEEPGFTHETKYAVLHRAVTP